MTQIDHGVELSERDGRTRKPWLQGVAISMTPELWDWEQSGYPPEPGYGLDGYPLQGEVNKRRREGKTA